MKQESKQDEATAEQPVESKESTKETPEVTSTEAKATSERPRTEEEFRKLQANMTRAIQDAQAKDQTLKSVQNQVQELQNEMERQRLDFEKKQINDLSDDPDAQKKLIAKFDLDKEKREFEAHQKREREGMNAAWQQAANLVAEFGLSPADVPELVNIANPDHMKDRAELIALRKGITVEKQEKAETPTGVETPAPDSGKSDAGGDSDEAFLKRWNSGDEPATKENLARAQKIINK